MSEKMRKGIVYMAFVAAVFFGASQFLNPPKQIVESETGSSGPVAGQTAAARIVAIEKTINVAEMMNKNWGDDPFRAVVKKSSGKNVSSQPRWKLSGIIFNSNKPLAVINDRTVTVGDKLGDTEVIEIDRKSVIMERAGARFTLTVSKG